MTQNHSDSDSIDRRTAIGIVSGGVAALSGCLGGSSSDAEFSPGSPGSTDAGGLLSTDGWVPPEEQSEYILDSQFVNDTEEPEPRVNLRLELQNGTEIDYVELIDARGNNYSSSNPEKGTVSLNLALGRTAFTAEEPEIEAISTGNHTVVIYFDDSDKDNQRISFNLETSVKFQQVTIAESIEGTFDDDDDLVIVIKNTGPHPTVLGVVQYANVPDDENQESSGKILTDEFTIIEPEQTGTVIIPDDVWRVVGQCEDYTERTLEFTVPLLWATTLNLSQTVSYSAENVCGSLDGSPTVTTLTDTESE